MTTTTLVYAGSLVTTQCWCGIHLAIPDSLYNEAQRNHKKDVYCPLGHSFIYNDSENERLKRDLKWAKAAQAASRSCPKRSGRGIAARHKGPRHPAPPPSAGW